MTVVAIAHRVGTVVLYVLGKDIDGNAIVRPAMVVAEHDGGLVFNDLDLQVFTNGNTDDPYLFDHERSDAGPSSRKRPDGKGNARNLVHREKVPFGGTTREKVLHLVRTWHSRLDVSEVR